MIVAGAIVKTLGVIVALILLAGVLIGLAAGHDRKS